MNEDTKLSDLTVAEFRKLMQECFQRDMDATKEVERLRNEFNNTPKQVRINDWLHEQQRARQIWK
jgi:hypothetical protein